MRGGTVSVRVTVEGAPALRAILRAIPNASRDGVRRHIKATALKVEVKAKELCPVDEGRTRNSITHEVDADGMGATVGTNLKSAPSVEFGRAAGRRMPPPGSLDGWMRRHGIPADADYAIRRAIAERGIPAKPFLFPALEYHRRGFYAELREILGDEIVRAAGRR